MKSVVTQRRVTDHFNGTIRLTNHNQSGHLCLPACAERVGSMMCEGVGAKGNGAAVYQGKYGTL